MEAIKVIIKEKVFDKLKELSDELSNDIRIHRVIDSARAREGSQNQNMRQPNQSTNLNESSNWIEILSNGFITMPLGTDNVYVPLKENDIGSVISFVLASNIYKEAMIKQNYMDISQKIKGLGKHPRQPGQITQVANTGTDVNPTPLGIHESSMNLGFTQQAQFQTQNTAPNNQDETIKLLGKNDVFNTELSAHQIETELLCGERLYFLVKFSTDKDDLSLRMVKNGNVAKLKQTSLNFTTGYILNSSNMHHQKQSARPFWNIQSKKNEKTKVELNDFQDKVCHELSKDYLDNAFYKESVNELDKVIGMLNFYYFKINQLAMNQMGQNTTGVNNTILSPPRTVVNLGIHQISSEESSNFDMVMDTHSNFNALETQHPFTTQNIRESMNANILANIKSPPLGSLTNTQNTPQMGQPTLNFDQWKSSENTEFCGIKSPSHTLTMNSISALRQQLNTPKVDFELKIYYPKKFEALRRFYCGSQYDFIQSLLKTKEWTTVSGGKTKSKFYRSLDDKYVYKEIKKGEFKMFLEFAPQYFDYLCKSFFHNYPCALCKILGAFKIKIITYKNGQQKIMKKYLYITENLNFGIKPEDESHIIRYDLKGSNKNRFVKNKENKDSGKAVLHDNNFLLEFMGRPLPIRYTINRILHICINNDTLCLSKSNIVDYSLLTIIDTKKKQVRFGIIDYVQQYTLDKIFESKFKNIINGGEDPTIVDPEKYKQRFKKAMKCYFVGMCIQEEKTSQPTKAEVQEQAQYDESEDDEEEGVNETMMGKYDKEENQANNITISKNDIGEIEIE